MPQKGRTIRHGARRGWVALALLAATLGARPASGDAGMPGGIVVGGLTVLVNVGGLVTLSGLSANLARGDRLSEGWLLAGGVFGALGAATGGSGLYLSGGDAGWPLAYSIVTLAVGLANIGLVIGGACMDEKEDDPIVRVSPLFLRDASGGYAAGVGVDVVRF